MMDYIYQTGRQLCPDLAGPRGRLTKAAGPRKAEVSRGHCEVHPFEKQHRGICVACPVPYEIVRTLLDREVY